MSGGAGTGVRGSLLSLTRRPDGSQQVTYRGHPLYYYVGDRSPGDILCQDAEEFGGHWWVVSPHGDAVT
jgi:predicted lipoprotein with Yx(FWY)xxD motif